MSNLNPLFETLQIRRYDGGHNQEFSDSYNISHKLARRIKDGREHTESGTLLTGPVSKAANAMKTAGQNAAKMLAPAKTLKKGWRRNLGKFVLGFEANPQITRGKSTKYDHNSGFGF